MGFIDKALTFRVSKLRVETETRDSKPEILPALEGLTTESQKLKPGTPHNAHRGNKKASTP